jgi:hypothetical protein
MISSTAPLAGTAGLLLALASTGCAPAAGISPGTPVGDPDSLALAIRAATTPSAPRQTTFGWSLDEAGSVVRGRGVVRHVAPDRIRLDLFGPRGETYLIAALVEDEFRIPASAAGAFELPSQALLWGALGVVRPPSGATLDAATTRGAQSILRYARPDGEVHAFTLTAGEAPRLVRLERIGPSGVLESVRVEYTDAGVPSRTTYVDRRNYRELVLVTESSRTVDSFPAEIWRPDGAGDQR